MRANFTDIIRKDYRTYLEPILATACKHQGSKLNITMSKYIRYSVINQLIKDGYPLNRISSKFNIFYKGVTTYR